MADDNDSALSSPLSSPCDLRNDPSSNNSDVEFDGIDLDSFDNDGNASIRARHVDTYAIANDKNTNRTADSSTASAPKNHGLRNITPPPRKHNGNGDNFDSGSDGDDGQPGKRKRAKATTPPAGRSRKRQAVSPPWKKVEAEGPSTLIENGRRKSGRISTLFTQADIPEVKRTPRAVFGPPLSPLDKTKQVPNGHGTATPSQARSAQAKSRSSKTTSHAASRQSTRISPITSDVKPSRSRRAPSPPPQPSRQPTRSSRRLTRQSLDDGDANDATPDTSAPTRPAPRIRLRIPIQLSNPCQVKAPKTATTFEEWWAKAAETPITEGGLLADDEPIYTAETALKDADIIARIEAELRPGGILSEGRCSALAPEPQPAPPRQYAQLDHLTKAAANLRRLMLAEKQRHRAIAKKLAEACRDRWIQRQPKTAAQLEAEARDGCLASYRIVLKTLSSTWDNVREDVNKRRYEEYEAEEQQRVKAALNQAVNLSEQKLAQRTGHVLSDEENEDFEGDVTDDGDFESDPNDDERGDGVSVEGVDVSDQSEEGNEADVDVDDGDDDDNMSSSSGEDDDDAEVDANLTQEQLRTKYANLPGLGLSNTSDKDQDSQGATSDESVDMDDDLGSSEGSFDGSGGEGSDDEELESEVEGQSGLLGLLFGKAELDKLNQEVESETLAQQEDDEEDNDVDMADATLGTDADSFVADEEDDEVCLVPEGNATTGKNTPRSALPSSAASPSGKSHGIDRTDMRAGGASTPVDQAGNSPEPMVVDSVPAVTDVPSTSSSEPMNQSNGHSDDPQRDDATSAEAPDSTKDFVPLSEPSHPPQSVATTIDTPMDQPATAAPSENAPSTTTTVSAAVAPRSESPQSAGPKTPIPFILRGTLREYQHYGLDWLAGLYANRTNGILADEMGLGKTIQTIALLAHLACQHEVWGPHLVIVPTSVMLNWEMEFKKWCPGFKILAYYGSQEERKRKRQGWTNDDVWNVCITSYQLVLQDHQVFRRRRWHYMILDEAHNIKNFKSQRWQTLLGFNTHSRLLLTGTPLQNNLTELWSLLFFLMPGEQNQAEGFADLDEFRQWFARPESQILESGREKMDDEARAIISKLHQVLRPYLLRRLKADVERQMPAKYEHVEICRLSKRQRELYDGFLSRTDTRETLASGNYLSIINCLMQLRKVCNHPDLFVDRPIMTSFKMSRSVPACYASLGQLVKDRLLVTKPMTVVDIGFLNLIPALMEGLATTTADRINSLTAQRTLNHHRDVQRARVGNVRPIPDGSTVHSVLAHFEWRARASRRHELQHNVYVSALRKQQRPIYGKNLIDMLTLGTEVRPHKPRPKVPKQILDWFTQESAVLGAMTPSVLQRARSCESTIAKFACVTPAVVTSDLGQLIMGTKGVQAFRDEDLRLSKPVRWAPFMPKERPPDPWHEARMRLSIQFPDKRLLQYDCGKLQALDRLLRKLQTGSHRALIFTQMTKVLDILEQFLNIHGHKYLRLDGATKVEQRQILTDRFNNDPRILCFILSTRSGGLGINLTGADTVIFYDQDWNPAMDKQCQDRCHRIGQTRDVHIYRLISEHTIEANILRKATQKQMLDDVVIQEGEFTTDYFNRLSVRDVIGDHNDELGGSSAADAVMDRLLGDSTDSDGRNVGKVLEQAEDREDVAAAKLAEKETQADEADFDENPAAARKEEPVVEEAAKPTQQEEEASGPVEYNAEGGRMGTIDDYMLRVMRVLVEGTALTLPKDKKSKKRRRDTRKR